MKIIDEWTVQKFQVESRIDAQRVTAAARVTADSPDQQIALNEEIDRLYKKICDDGKEEIQEKSLQCNCN